MTTTAEQRIGDGHLEMKLEVDILPVSDVDRAKRFYGSLGWRVDADYTPPGEDVDVSEVFHAAEGVFARAGGVGQVAGPDPQGRSYRTWASFRDPDGNGWLLQEIKTRLPGRGGLVTEVATLTDLFALHVEGGQR